MQKPDAHVASTNDVGTASEEGPLHTPGPWVARETVGYRVYADCKAGSLIATPGYFRDERREKANARLIAAAPDLLDALVAAHELLSKGEAISDADYVVVSRAAAAISKATA